VQPWSGCKRATKCEIEMDFRVGGTFTQKMQIQGAGEFSFSGVYEQIDEPERIVYLANLGFTTTRVSVEFIDQGAQTRVVLTQDGLPDQGHFRRLGQAGSGASGGPDVGGLTARLACCPGLR
jgi:uncharacterized protein YndB with AHSA1/START domain